MDSPRVYVQRFFSWYHSHKRDWQPHEEFIEEFRREHVPYVVNERGDVEPLAWYENDTELLGLGAMTEAPGRLETEVEE